MIITNRISIVSLLVLLSLTFALTGQAMQRKSSFRYSKFQPGDAVRISILEIMDSQASKDLKSFNIDDDYTIGRDGNILLPLVGEIKVVGHDQESLIELLTEQYSPYFKEPFITVLPLIRVTLMGAFNKPGSYRIDPEESLWELIDLAGGPSSDCNLKSLKVERGGKVVVKDLLSSFEMGHTLEEIGVRSGDQVLADEKKEFGIREVLDWAKFGVTLVVLYLQIERYSN
ncbi:MAG: polysaccharide biosynthesis/export family protein [candidate division KSB1 bacterium]|nr:polysaccharide biosynthesis/export family protein [candidate division KSB1 bacterium]